ncbi:hypothetical protein MN116_001621 [Schistosoma mekongi]|uniref:Large ribosomal subunit protein mL37 n=1 Tax=Schistosoma mekongi TaxID=38744 RepID=A0AAE1ZJ49_SCHME|nr:hypothetical protein MN116_001621 [Schistosoma mekongi]
MKVTEILCHGKRIRHDKLQFLTNLYWRTHGSKLKVSCLRVPEQVLNDPNNPLKEAENMFKSTRYDDALLNEIEIGITSEKAKILEQQEAERLQCLNPLFGDVRFHQDSEPSLIFSSKRRFSKGVDQASLLTNTVITFGAPPTLNNLFNRITELNEHVNSDNFIADWRSSLRLAVERSILHAHVWQTDETKLPRRFHPNSSVWKHKPEYGIHPQQSTRYLFHNLFRILESQVPRYMNFTRLTPINNQFSNGLPFRWTTRDRLLETFYHWGPEKRRINFSEQHDLVIMGQTPAPLFLTDHGTIRKLSQAATMPVAGFGPMSPLIDLTSTLYYREDSTNGWLGNQTRRYAFPHIFTVNFSLPSVWSDYLEPEADPVIPEHRYAIALMNCFASAIAQARSMGIDKGILDKPICIQCVCSDGVYFDFVTFQLNTMDVPDYQSDHQVDHTMPKNFAWIDGDHRLFNKIVPKKRMLRSTKYRDINMSVFDRLSCYYLCGLLNTSFNINESLIPELNTIRDQMHT